MKKEDLKKELDRLRVSCDNWKAIATEALQKLWELENKKFLKKLK